MPQVHGTQVGKKASAFLVLFLFHSCCVDVGRRRGEKRGAIIHTATYSLLISWYEGWNSSGGTLVVVVVVVVVVPQRRLHPHSSLAPSESSRLHKFQQEVPCAG